MHRLSTPDALRCVVVVVQVRCVSDWTRRRWLSVAVVRRTVSGWSVGSSAVVTRSRASSVATASTGARASSTGSSASETRSSSAARWLAGTRRRSATRRRASCTSTAPSRPTFSLWPTTRWRAAARSSSTWPTCRRPHPAERRGPGRSRPRWRSVAPRSKCRQWTWRLDSVSAVRLTSLVNSYWRAATDTNQPADTFGRSQWTSRKDVQRVGGHREISLPRIVKWGKTYCEIGVAALHAVTKRANQSISPYCSYAPQSWGVSPSDSGG